MKNTFFKFAAKANQVPFDLDETCRVLLTSIGLYNHAGTPLTVTQAMKLEQLASPATLHRKLDTLLAHGYITMEYEGKNRRTKYLTPTHKANTYFALMGNAVIVGADQ